MSKVLQLTGFRDIVDGLENIQLGQTIRYGSQNNGMALGLDADEYPAVLKIVEGLEAEHRIMRFHSDGYYVAIGVTPWAKSIFERYGQQASTKPGRKLA